MQFKKTQISKNKIHKYFEKDKQPKQEGNIELTPSALSLQLVCFLNIQFTTIYRLT